MALELIENSAVPGTEPPISTLSAALGTAAALSTSTLKVTSPVALAGLKPTGQFRIRIDAEILLVTGGQNTTTWNVVRGVEGPAPTAHAVNAQIFHDLTVGALLNLPIGYGQLPAGVPTSVVVGPVTVSGNYKPDLSNGQRVFRLKEGGGGKIVLQDPINLPSGNGTLEIAVEVEGEPPTHTLVDEWLWGEVPVENGVAKRRYVYISDDHATWKGIGEGRLPANLLQAPLAPGVLTSDGTTVAFVASTGLSQSQVDVRVALKALGNNQGRPLPFIGSGFVPGAFPFVPFPLPRTLAATLPTTATITAIPLTTGTGEPLWKGQAIVLTWAGKTQTFVLSADVAEGSTSLPVESEKPKYAFAATETTVQPVLPGALNWESLNSAVLERAPRRQFADPVPLTTSGTVLQIGHTYLATKANATYPLPSSFLPLAAQGERIVVKNVATGPITIEGHFDQEVTVSGVVIEPGEVAVFEGNLGPTEWRVAGGYRPLANLEALMHGPWTAMNLPAKMQQAASATAHGARLEAAGTVVRLRGVIEVKSTTSISSGEKIATLPAGCRPVVNNFLIQAHNVASGAAVMLVGNTAGELISPALAGATQISFDATPTFAIA